MKKKIREGDMKNVKIGDSIFKSGQKTCHLHVLKKLPVNPWLLRKEQVGKQ